MGGREARSQRIIYLEVDKHKMAEFGNGGGRSSSSPKLGMQVLTGHIPVKQFSQSYAHQQDESNNFLLIRNREKKTYSNRNVSADTDFLDIQACRIKRTSLIKLPSPSLPPQKCTLFFQVNHSVLCKPNKSHNQSSYYYYYCY